MRIENGRLVVRTGKKVAYIGFVRGEFRVKICGLVNEGDCVREHLIVLKEYTQAFRVVNKLKKLTIMNKAKREYKRESAAKDAMIRKAHYLYYGGKSGHIPFGRIWYEDNVLYAESTYWTESTLSDFLNDNREL
jgi:hypothetical protein